jgi:hypothetical protein
MGELDDVEHAEEQREPNGHERIHHPEHQPVHDVLGQQPGAHVPNASSNVAWRPARLRDIYFWPGSLRLPLAYSLSSHSTNLPSWIT